jgi:aryl-alcohol dehydrogenase-like predicted oxidoreductase
MANASGCKTSVGGYVLQKRQIGKTDVEVSVIGLGTVKFGRNQGVKYPQAFSLPTDNEIEALLRTAEELGINLLDTAPAYGTSEERLGNLLRGSRQKWVISTKVGEEFVDGESQFDFSATHLRQSIERSLLRLHTDYLDIVLVHSDGHDVNIIESEHVFSMLAALKKEGKIRAYGMSTKTLAGARLTIDLADVVMLTYNPTYADERTMIDYAHQHQKGVFIKKAFASGHLQMPIKDVMQFVFSEPGVTSVIVGTLNKEHLRENVTSALQVLGGKPW